MLWKKRSTLRESWKEMLWVRGVVEVQTEKEKGEKMKPLVFQKRLCEAYIKGWKDSMSYFEGKEKIKQSLPRKFVGTFEDIPGGCRMYSPFGAGPFEVGIESSIKYEALKESKKPGRKL